MVFTQIQFFNNAALEHLFLSGSIAENISYGQHDVSMERVEAAAKVAGIHQFVMKLR